LAVQKSRRSAVGERVHQAALDAVVAYAKSRLSLVRAHPVTLPSQAAETLYTAWFFYVFAVRMSYGGLPASLRHISEERLQQVVGTVREALERTFKKKRIPPLLGALGLDALKEAEEVAIAVGRSRSARKRIVTSGRMPQIPGTTYLLLRTEPSVLMRRAVIAQLLRDRPNCTHKEICGRLDFNDCAVPAQWSRAGYCEGWMSAYCSPRLKGRLKKLLSDDLDELKKWGAV
jgi:hypothetical protein